MNPADSADPVRRCDPCCGSGKRHSIFDDCWCDPECEGLGACANCGGTGTLIDGSQAGGGEG